MRDERGNDWSRHDLRTDDAPVIDPEKGEERIIRAFVVQTDPTKELEPKEVLKFHEKTIMDTLWKDGWVLDRELTIEQMKDGFYSISAIAKPAMKHGSVIGATNDSPINAAKGLQEHK